MSKQEHTRDKTLSAAFRASTDWGGGEPRFDYAMQGASAARVPSLFFAHDQSQPAGRSVAICSVHFAFGPGGTSDTRERQLAHLASLMPGGRYDPRRCLYALMGDMNSNASVAQRGHDLASSELGKQLLASINASSSGHTLALKPGKVTSIGGERYDEIIVHEAAFGSRTAHVFPTHDQIGERQMRAALPVEEQEEYKSVHMAFCNIFSDHLPVYVDLEFEAGAAAKGHPASKRSVQAEAPKEALSTPRGAKAAAEVTAKAPAKAPAKEARTKTAKAPAAAKKEHETALGKVAVSVPGITCKSCLAGKGCRWRGRDGHLPEEEVEIQ
jgi:hypothetical protein